MDDSILENETGEQINNRPWLYKKGQSGNPSGRPKGRKSMKQWIKEKLEKMTDEEREVFLEGCDKSIIWKMAEGNPDSKIEGDVNVKVEKLESIQEATKSILDGQNKKSIKRVGRK